jgi:hypothetical protein
MAQLKNVVDPFGEVNVHPAPGGKKRVIATILMTPHKEGAQTGIALDGSGSMRRAYGMEGGGRVLSPIFGGGPKPVNEITPVAQKLCSYLARNVDADGGTTAIYWAVGPNGGEIEVIGDLTAEQAERHHFGPPRDMGTGTQLMPALRYFVDRFRTAPWGFYVFITDGELHDLEAVIDYSKRLAREIHAGRRNPVKLVLVGVGPEVSEHQMNELDDLDTGTPIDLWDHKVAREMRALEQVFAEVVDRNARVANNGRILLPDGSVARDYREGLPAYLEFEVPASATYFTLEVNGVQVRQTLEDALQAPPSSGIPAAPPQGASKPAAAAASQQSPASDPEMAEHLPVDGLDESEWKSLPLELEKDRPQPPQ